MPLLRHRPPAIIAAALAAVVVGIAAGCGSSSSSSSTPATTPASTPATTATTVTTPTTATTSTTAGTPTTKGTTQQFTTDLTTANSALTDFAKVIQSGGSNLSDLQANVPKARADVKKFDGAITNIGTYSLDSPALERKRSGIAGTGHQVSDTLNRFLDAVEKGDQSAAIAVLPDLQSAISAFSSAATS
jgi:hypothetical protein